MKIDQNNKQKLPLVSIILPTYNRADKLVTAINSVFQQSFVDWELIIVDNNSTDKTSQIINNYNSKKIKYFRVNNKGVIAYSRNYGVNKSEGKYIAFLDSDDWWSKDKLSCSIKFLKKFNADISYHNCRIVSKFKNTKTNCRNLNKDIFHDLIINGNTIVNSSVVLKKSSFMSVGGFSEEKYIIGWEDYHLWIRLAEVVHKFIFIKNIHGYLLKDEDNFDNSQRILLNLKNIKSFFYEKIDFDIRKIWWIDYTKAKALFNIDKSFRNIKYFLLVIFNRSPYIYKIKSIFMIIFIIINKIKL